MREVAKRIPLRGDQARIGRLYCPQQVIAGDVTAEPYSVFHTQTTRQQTELALVGAFAEDLQTQSGNFLPQQGYRPHRGIESVTVLNGPVANDGESSRLTRLRGDDGTGTENRLVGRVHHDADPMRVGTAVKKDP